VSCRLHGGVRGPPANFGCWAKTKEKGRKEKEDRFEIFEKKIQANEFKHKFEFKQSKMMLQHVCNNKLL
jgi:hypothetical protein